MVAEGKMCRIYPLVMTSIAMVKQCSIEIDGLPFLKMVDLSNICSKVIFPRNLHLE
jgi:hypothetical protein